ncbi:MAG: ATP-binding protein [Candidatus Omnitrophica bacterium]|nr:ATP-binding protein [Candidatus Omnitrophota bacterium]
MKKLIKRKTETENINNLTSSFPVTAILGPRQCGKTVIANQIRFEYYFDLENPRDSVGLENPQLALEDLKGLIVIDEIQRAPDIFQLIRYLVDSNPKQKYLILGSASKDLIQQSSESLAGRIAYHRLGGFTLSDIGKKNLQKLWLRGGFPRSYLAKSYDESFLWLENYISTFLERDIPQLGIFIPARTLRKFWIMISHYHSQVVNHSEIGRSFGISDMTVKKYINILEGTFMLRVLQPWYTNTKKRLIKRPKIYIRDSGIFHSLISIGNKKQLFSHNKLGASWEGLALECIARSLNKRDEELYFWQTHAGAELDLFWQHKGKNWGVEFKYSDAPRKTRSMEIALKDLELAHLWVIYPGKTNYKLGKKLSVVPLSDIKAVWDYHTG